MSVLGDAIAAIKDVLKMQGEVDRLSRNVTVLVDRVMDIDKRLVRIETMIEIGQRSAKWLPREG